MILCNNSLTKFYKAGNYLASLQDGNPHLESSLTVRKINLDGTSFPIATRETWCDGGVFKYVYEDGDKVQISGVSKNCLKEDGLRYLWIQIKEIIHFAHSLEKVEK